MLEGLGDDRLAVASCLPLRGAVVEDDRPSILRWIEVVGAGTRSKRARAGIEIEITQTLKQYGFYDRIVKAQMLE